LCDFGGEQLMAAFRTSAQSLPLYRFPNRETVATPAPGSDHDCVVALKALAEDTRVRIIRLLITGPLDVGDISERAGISQYNTSKHLRVLREAGLLQAQKNGRRHLYALTEGIGRRMAEGGVLDLGCCSFQFEDEARRSRPPASGRSPVRRPVRRVPRARR
jgi:DNA-binding transcriptional ArsR family regulator